ncbi:MAG: hypothetical protein MZV70_67605 [Desulfobacterales bacterium]|nr:hypothetical protein [Desulfobacterales bacterium]
MPDGLAGHRVGGPGDAPAPQGRRDAGGGAQDTVEMIQAGRAPGQRALHDGASGRDRGVDPRGRAISSFRWGSTT